MDLFEYFRPGFDLEEEQRRRAESGVLNGFGPDDLYPDARACLAGLRDQGLYVGIAGNQPVEAAEQMAALGLEADVVGISDVWGVSKPSQEFFERCAQLADVLPDRVLYVGDRIDNDVRPALAFGMRAAFLRRGPWGTSRRTTARSANACSSWTTWPVYRSSSPSTTPPRGRPLIRE